MPVFCPEYFVFSMFEYSECDITWNTYTTLILIAVTILHYVGTENVESSSGVTFVT
jgi:hypothetical protein